MHNIQALYTSTILDRITIYQKGLSEMRTYIAAKQFDEAAVYGLQSLLESESGNIQTAENIPDLLRICAESIEGFSIKRFHTKTSKELATMIEGILIERYAFYRQLEVLTH